ncbi:MAG: PP0621 family protein, partial [Nitrosomonadales bacterium]|nr:PP0621 family protein [Nitrosomonadales bacterium]
MSISGLHFVSDQDLATIVSTYQDLTLMAKLILIAIAIWLIFTILKRYRKGIDQSEGGATGRQGSSEAMVQCAYCGIHLPKSEGIQSHGQYFCSQAHT